MRFRFISLVANPSGCTIYISSSSLPSKYAVPVDLPLLERSERKNNVVGGELGDGCICLEAIDSYALENPRATNFALNRMSPSALCFTLKTHLQVTRCLPGGNLTSSHAPFLTFVKSLEIIRFRRSLSYHVLNHDSWAKSRTHINVIAPQKLYDQESGTPGVAKLFSLICQPMHIRMFKSHAMH